MCEHSLCERLWTVSVCVIRDCTHTYVVSVLFPSVCLSKTRDTLSCDCVQSLCVRCVHTVSVRECVSLAETRVSARETHSLADSLVSLCVSLEDTRHMRERHGRDTWERHKRETHKKEGLCERLCLSRRHEGDTQRETRLSARDTQRRKARQRQRRRDCFYVLLFLRLKLSPL